MRFAFTVLLVFGLSVSSMAVEKTFAAGKIINVTEKKNTQVLYYQVDTPITRDEPYYEISVELNQFIYRGVYTPRHTADRLPPEWMPGAAVKVRLAGKNLFLLEPQGEELQLPIIKRTEVKDDAPSPDAIQKKSPTD